MVFTIKKRMEVYFTKTRFVLDLQPAASANCPRTILFISLRAYDKTLEDWIGLMPLTVLGYVALMKNTEFERYCKNFCLPPSESALFRYDRLTNLSPYHLHHGTR